MDHDPGSGAVEWNHPGGLLYAELGLVHDVPGTGWNRGGQLQHNCPHNHLGSVYAQHAIKDVGVLLLCHTRGIGIRVSGRAAITGKGISFILIIPLPFLVT